ncbi:MAG TPA: LysR family transcriptional regulator [Candidatus Cybelea sp.]|nr:LysR family transcriptional regulator [Candidatus Cybelea sp.]
MAVFAGVVQARSFSAAARQLGISKSAVSKHVSRLEEKLAARLLNRTTRRLSLTEAGTTYYEYCARVVAEAEEAERAVAALRAEPRGLLKINAPMSFSLRHLGPALPEFLARYPDIRVDLHLTDRVVDLIEEGYDVAVRITKLADSSLVARRIAPNRSVICGSPDYFAKYGVPQTPDDLKDHRFLVYTYSAADPGSHGEWLFRTADGARPVRVAGALQANNGDVLRAAALAGVGLIASPTFIVGPDLQAGRLKCVLRDYVGEGSAIYAVYPHRRHLTAKVRAFVDFLGEKFGPEPYWDAWITQGEPS